MNKDPTNHSYLKGTELVFLTIGLSLGTFIQILDTSIANVSIPNIAGDLGASPDQGTWVITSFAVSNAIVLPMTGWLSMRFGESRVFIWSILLFSLISWLCGLAWSLPVLIFLRVLQGAAAGTLIPLSQGLLLQNYPPDKKGLALGLWSMVVVAAPLLGPIMGGWITDNYGWPWIFYINVPIGMLSAYITWKILGAKKSEAKKVPIDIIGFALLIIGVGSLQIMLDKGNELDWFGSNQIILLSITATLGLLFFGVWNYYSLHPVVDFSFFSQRNFLMATLLSALGYSIFFGSLIVQPLWLQVSEGYTPFWAGVTVAPFGIFTIILSPFVGRYIHRVDSRKLITLSFFILAISHYWVSTFNTNVSLYEIIMPRVLQGLGLSFFFIPLITIALSEIPNKNLSSASGIFNFVRLIAGGGFGTAIFVTLWSRWTKFHHAQLSERVNEYKEVTRQYIMHLKELGFSGDSIYQLMDNIMTQQASMLSINDLYWISALIFLVSIPLIWLCKPVKAHNAPIGVE